MLVTIQPRQYRRTCPGQDTAFGDPVPMTDDLQSRLEQLIEQWHRATAPGPKAKLLQQILSTMDRSGKLWRGPGVARDLYEEALQNNWLWFTTHLNEYDPTQATVMHWFNRYLKWSISELQRQRTREDKYRYQPRPDGAISSVENLAVPEPEESEDFQTSLKRIKCCVADHQRQLRRRSMRGRTDVSCDRIMAALLERVEQASSAEALSDIFAQLAADWQLDRDTLRRFCSSSCFKLLRQLCQPN